MYFYEIIRIYVLWTFTIHLKKFNEFKQKCYMYILCIMQQKLLIIFSKIIDLFLEKLQLLIINSKSLENGICKRYEKNAIQ